MKKKHKPKPNFLIIGAAKAGTSSLGFLLGAHPEAGIVLGGQPNFFSFDDKYKLGWKKYLRLFEHCVGKEAVGDCSRSYSRIRYHPQVVSRIHEHIPRARIIYMVRHPLDRMVAAYVERMNHPNPPSFASINDAVRKEPMIIDSSRYWEVFDAYRQTFGESRIKVLWYEEYVANPTQVFREVCRFLQIDDEIPPDLSHPRAEPGADAEESKAPISSSGIQLVTGWDDETRGWVLEQIRDDNTRFLQHFSKPLDFWGTLF
ncbi:MAG TPA: sulfotransferase [Verrucomicrobiota bacterium]|nr:sulfotransferase [Verrucomicrobiota bacterium]